MKAYLSFVLLLIGMTFDCFSQAQTSATTNFSGLDLSGVNAYKYTTRMDIYNVKRKSDSVRLIAKQYSDSIAAYTDSVTNALIDSFRNQLSQKASVADFSKMQESINGTYIALEGDTLFMFNSEHAQLSKIILPKNTGPQGVQGPPGAKGDVGATGANGPPGSQGIQGIKGDKGDAGATGATGASGTQGIQGIAGTSGATGQKGDKGDKGDTGSQGIAGTNGTNGTNGSQGIQGIQGLQGPAGSNANVTSSSVISALGYTPIATEVQTLSLASGNLSISGGNVVSLPIYDSAQIYTTGGRIRQRLKLWSAITTPTTAQGQTIDISSAGFTTILGIQVQAAKNTTDITQVPFVSIKSFTNTQVSVNIGQSNSGVIGLLVGLLFPTSVTGTTLHTTVIGY